VPRNRHVVSDRIIRLTGVDTRDTCDFYLRRIEVWNQEENEILVFLTNHMKLGSITIAAIYRDRWQIEIFLKRSNRT